MSTSSVGSSSKIDGLVSGLNTSAIISAIMQAAALPQSNLKNQLLVEQSKLAAYQTLNSDMASLQSAADALNSPTTWQAMTVASSSTSVAATASAGAAAGTFTFDVNKLATGQSSVSANTVSSTSAAVTTTGTPVTLTVGSGSAVTIDTGDGSLGAVVAGINAAKTGVQAAAVQVSSGVYRLQLTSTTTGANATFSVTGLDTGPLGVMNNTSTAQDAQITVGAGTPGAYTITSSSNTFSNAIPDLTFTVSQQVTGVTLTTTPDSSGIADKVQAMVDAANSVLTAITGDTKFDTSSNTGSVLTGDYTVRELQDNILNTISSALGNGTSATTVGLAVTKDGAITFDKSAFETAFTADPAATQAAFGPTGSFAAAQSGLTGTITLQNSTDATQGGSYAVTVTQAATKASSTIDTTNGGTGLVAGQTITIGSGTNSATYTVQSGDTVSSVVSSLNSLAATNSIGVTANVDGTNGSLIDLADTAYGSSSTFTSSATGGLVASAVTAGLDVAGTIDGHAAKGVGQLLYTDPGTPGVDALTLNVTLTTADVAALTGGNAGTFTYRAGVSQELASVANAAVATTTGSLTNEITNENTLITDLNTQISNWQVVLDSKQAALQTQWANLETQLSNLQAQGSQLSAAILSMTGSTSTSSKK
jgi:flagellar hook-associated protein 2